MMNRHGQLWFVIELWCEEHFTFRGWRISILRVTARMNQTVHINIKIVVYNAIRIFLKQIQWHSDPLDTSFPDSTEMVGITI